MTSPALSDALLDSRLDAAHTTVLAEISRTDAKSGVLLTSFSLPLAALVAAVPGHRLPPVVGVLVGASAVGLIVAMLVVLVVVHPRLSGAARGSFLYWSLCTPQDLVKDLQAPEDRVAHVIHLSKIARRKYEGLRLAGIITGAALVALGAALLTALIT
ncbi:Pycsar system effector family protein [Streptomyces sp. NPDC020983]|uniref:Pycsar system effector family protein n=1 Tax=Streptomyces sp. NPDC020983 TaxID=3365106 RepID=UPI003790ED22